MLLFYQIYYGNRSDCSIFRKKKIILYYGENCLSCLKSGSARETATSALNVYMAQAQFKRLQTSLIFTSDASLLCSLELSGQVLPHTEA